MENCGLVTGSSMWMITKSDTTQGKENNNIFIIDMSIWDYLVCIEKFH